jgi:hypothetical protein
VYICGEKGGRGGQRQRKRDREGVVYSGGGTERKRRRAGRGERGRAPLLLCCSRDTDTAPCSARAPCGAGVPSQGGSICALRAAAGVRLGRALLVGLCPYGCMCVRVRAHVCMLTYTFVERGRAADCRRVRERSVWGGGRKLSVCVCVYIYIFIYIYTHTVEHCRSMVQTG